MLLNMSNNLKSFSGNLCYFVLRTRVCFVLSFPLMVTVALPLLQRSASAFPSCQVRNPFSRSYNLHVRYWQLVAATFTTDAATKARYFLILNDSSTVDCPLTQNIRCAVNEYKHTTFLSISSSLKQSTCLASKNTRCHIPATHVVPLTKTDALVSVRNINTPVCYQQLWLTITCRAPLSFHSQCSTPYVCRAPLFRLAFRAYPIGRPFTFLF